LDYFTAGSVITHSSAPAALHAPVDGSLPPLSGCASPGSLPGADIAPPLLGGYVVALACPRCVLLLEVDLSLHCARRIGLRFDLVCGRSRSALVWADVARIQSTEFITVAEVSLHPARALPRMSQPPCLAAPSLLRLPRPPRPSNPPRSSCPAPPL
jgi:hypothetical protein